MKTWALTERDPWGSLMAWEEKRIETRSFCPPRFIVDQLPIRVALHLSKKLGTEDALGCVHAPFASVLHRHGVTFQWGTRKMLTVSGLLPAGHIVATYTLLAVEQMDGPLVPGRLRRMGYNRWPQWNMQQELAFGNYAAGRWAYLITDVRLLAEPIPIKGALGFWPVDLPEEGRSAA